MEDETVGRIRQVYQQYLEAKASKVWFDQENLCVAFYDGRQLSVPLAYFPRLLNATAQ